jgi:NhaP-type Na+/H+ and K+/H+ antiporter
MKKQEKIDIIEHFEKKIRKYLRIHRIFTKGDILKVDDKLCLEVVKSVIKDLPVTYTKNTQKATKIVLPITLDDENNQLLNSLFHNKSINNNKIIALFSPLSDKETSQLANAYGLKFAPNAKDASIQNIIETLYKDHPEIKNALRKTALELRDFLK